MKKLFFFILSFAQAINTFGQSSKQSNTINLNWKLHESSNFSVRYPSTWQLNLDRKMGEIFTVFSPLESTQDRFSENVNLFEENLLSSKVNLDTYTKKSIDQLRIYINNFSLIENKRLKNGSNEYHQLIYKGNQGVFQLIYTQNYWIKDNKAYILTFTSEQSKYPKFKELGESILKSYTFK